MGKTEFSTPQKNRIIAEFHTKKESGHSVRSIFAEKELNLEIEKGNWPVRSTYNKWLREIKKYGIDEGSRRNRKKSLVTGRPKSAAAQVQLKG